jgi:hypothetical protein
MSVITDRTMNHCTAATLLCEAGATPPEVGHVLDRRQGNEDVRGLHGPAPTLAANAIAKPEDHRDTSWPRRERRRIDCKPNANGR